MKSEGEILLGFVQGDDGKKWAEDRRGWSKEMPVCNWSGVGCNDSKDVSKITDIDLSDSQLVARIPDLSELKSLIRVDFSENFLMGSIPIGFAELPNLEYVDLSENQLTGTVSIFKSKKLRSLNLGYNRLIGTLNKDICSLHPSLSDFDIIRNKISGTIPESLSQLKGLVGLSLSQNNFSGTIPSGFGMIETLKYLYLDENKLVGTLPSSFSRDSSNMEELWLQNNLLSGTIPAHLSALTKLVDLYIDGNKFTGTIPIDLCRENLNSDFFEYVVGNQERDYCDSISCPADTYSLRGIFPCFPCSPNSTKHYFSPYLGKTTSCFDLNQRDILLKFLQDTGGKDSWKQENWDVENSFLCSFTGISCDVNNHVTAIDLKNMGLKGTIPQEIGFLRYLTRLDLSNNQLTGFLPSDLRFAPLSFLDVSGNFLKGVVPPMLCLKAGINGNGDQGDYNCANIACPAGTYSPAGNSQPNQECIPCHGQDFLASLTCATLSSYSLPINYKQATEAFIFLGFFLLFLFLTLTQFKKRSLSLREPNHLLQHLDSDDHSLSTSSSQDSTASVSSMTPTVPRNISIGSFGSSIPRNITQNSVDSSVNSAASSHSSSAANERNEGTNNHSVWLDVPKLT